MSLCQDWLLNKMDQLLFLVIKARRYKLVIFIEWISINHYNIDMVFIYLCFYYLSSIIIRR